MAGGVEYARTVAGAQALEKRVPGRIAEPSRHVSRHHRPIETGQLREPVESQVNGRDIAVANEPLGVLPHGLEVNQINDPRRAGAPARREDRPDVIPGPHAVEIGSSILVVRVDLALPRQDVLAQLDLEPKGLEERHARTQTAGVSRRAWRENADPASWYGGRGRNERCIGNSVWLGV